MNPAGVHGLQHLARHEQARQELHEKIKAMRFGPDDECGVNMELWQRLLKHSVHDWQWAYEWIREGMPEPPRWLLNAHGLDENGEPLRGTGCRECP